MRFISYISSRLCYTLVVLFLFLQPIALVSLVIAQKAEKENTCCQQNKDNACTHNEQEDMSCAACCTTSTTQQRYVSLGTYFYTPKQFYKKQITQQQEHQTLQLLIQHAQYFTKNVYLNTLNLFHTHHTLFLWLHNLRL